MKLKSSYRVAPGDKLRLKDCPTDSTGGYKDEKEAAKELERHRRRLDELQNISLG